jgi:methionyl aminopeptidase
MVSSTAPLNNITLQSCVASLITFGAGETKKKKKKKKPKKKKKVEQGDPPRTGLSKVYPDGKYPVGEIQEYRDE